MLLVPEFEHPQQGPESLSRTKYLIAFTNKITEHAPHVVEALRRDVFEPHGSVLLESMRSSVWEDLERHAFELARPVFRRRYPGYDPLPDLLMSGLSFSGVQQRDGLAAGLVDDAITEDIAVHPECYPWQCRLLGMMSLQQGRGSVTTWMMITSADEMYRHELVKPREAIADWADHYNLRTHPRAGNSDADEWLFEEPFCGVAMSTVCLWGREEVDGQLYSGAYHSPPMPMCSCERPRAPGWYTHSVIDCPAMVERHGPRPQQTLVKLLPDWPCYEPFPRHLKGFGAHNRKYHSEQVETWLASYLSREAVVSSRSAFAAIPEISPGSRHDYIKQLKETDRRECNAIDEWCLALGLQRAPKPDATLEDHVTWAVRFQLLRESDYSIARSLEDKSKRPRQTTSSRAGAESRVSTDTVHRAVRRVLALLRIKPRPHRYRAHAH